LCTALAAQTSRLETHNLLEPIGEFLDRHHFSNLFREGYFLPMVACIWSCPTAKMLRFPMLTMVRFCHNHGLLQMSNRPRWFTVRGGAKHYVEKMLQHITDARRNTPVRGVLRLAHGVLLHLDSGTEPFDEVVFACHSDQALALLANPSPLEQQVLGAITYQNNEAVLHTDTAVLPKRRLAWAAWNYERAAKAGNEAHQVCLHYLLNRLQPLPFQTSVVLSLNPVRKPNPQTVHGQYQYAHPVFDAQAIAAQAHVPALQGQQHSWFCGAWTRYGFHEDGLMSGLNVAQQLRAQGLTPKDKIQPQRELEVAPL
jgi:uncharacterized protein